jgi:hypothetical protein
MNDQTICPNCGFANEADATVCALCQATLSPTIPTVPATTQSAAGIKPVAPNQSTFAANLPPNVVGLYMRDQREPILFRFSEKPLTLGRDFGPDELPALDLTPYGAQVMGVSRAHASIRQTEKGYILEDLGSTNGTMVNQTTLEPNVPHPLKSGDLITLGNFKLKITFSQIAHEYDSIYLRYEGGQLLNPTPTEIMTAVMPYIQAIDDLQALIDSFLNRESNEISVIGMSLEEATLHVKLAGATEAVQFVKKHVATWREKFVPARNGEKLANGDDGETSKTTSNAEDVIPHLTKALVKELSGRSKTRHLDISEYEERLAAGLYYLMTNDLGVIGSQRTATL